MSDTETIVLTTDQYNERHKQGQIDILRKLITAGFTPETLSASSGVSITMINNIAQTAKLTPEEETVAEMSRTVMVRSLAYCLWQLEHGAPEKKMAIAMRVLPTAMKLIGRSEATSGDMEEALNTILTLQRSIPAPRLVKDRDAS